jgi:outer membrane protein assembly factor BamB
VFAFFGASGAVAYDIAGNELWHNDELGSNTAGFGSASSPVEHGDLVYVNASIESDTLFALDKKTGKVAWKRDGIMKCWSSPCLAKNERGETELIINQKFTVYGLDPTTGKELWSCTGIEDYVVPTPVIGDGIIYCLGGRSNKALAIKLGGTGDVTKSHRLWFTNVGANVTSPVLYDGHLYWASDKGIANCMKASDGESVYRERMPTKARVYASIVRAADKLYLTTRDSGVWVLAAEPEFRVLALNKIESDDSMVNASPAISNGQVLMRTDKFLYCIGEK